MVEGRSNKRRRTAPVAAAFLGAVWQLGFLQSCDDRLIGLTRFVEPCGTFLANCQPGDFLINRSELGASCDPTCVVPGQCGEQAPLSVIREICP
jgi:hypothetical protein